MDQQRHSECHFFGKYEPASLADSISIFFQPCWLQDSFIGTGLMRLCLNSHTCTILSIEQLIERRRSLVQINHRFRLMGSKGAVRAVRRIVPLHPSRQCATFIRSYYSRQVRTKLICSNVSGELPLPRLRSDD